MAFCDRTQVLKHAQRNRVLISRCRMAWRLIEQAFHNLPTIHSWFNRWFIEGPPPPPGALVLPTAAPHQEGKGAAAAPLPTVAGPHGFLPLVSIPATAAAFPTTGSIPGGPVMTAATTAAFPTTGSIPGAAAVTGNRVGLPSPTRVSSDSRTYFCGSSHCSFSNYRLYSNSDR